MMLIGACCYGCQIIVFFLIGYVSMPTALNRSQCVLCHHSSAQSTVHELYWAVTTELSSESHQYFCLVGLDILKFHINR